MTKNLPTIVATLAVLAFSPIVSAQVAEVALDNPTIQAVDGSNTPGFDGLSHTGSLLFTPNGSTFAFLSFDDVQQPVAWAPFTSPALTALTGSTLPVPYATAGQLILNNGVVTGGEINVVLSNGDVFSTDILANSGSVKPIAGGFFISGTLATASFSGNTFGGYDVSSFAGIHGGKFILSNYSPDSNGVDSSNELDLRLNVEEDPIPEPASIALIALGVAAMLPRRR